MSDVSMAQLTSSQRYRLITGSVMPRPIALITTMGPDGRCNAAPYSAFNYMGEDPPMLAVAIERYGDESHRPGEVKDTLRNILATGEFVVNMVDEPLLASMVACATDYPTHMSETDVLGLATEPSQTVSVPRLVQAPITWECRRYAILDFSHLRSIVFGEIVSMHFRDGLLDEAALRVNVDRYQPCGRLGGPNYCRTTDRIRLPVPTFDPSRGVPRS